MTDLKCIYYELKNNDEYNEIITKSFYQFKSDKLEDSYCIDILESWLVSKLKYDNISHSLVCSLYYILKHDILNTHEFFI